MFRRNVSKALDGMLVRTECNKTLTRVTIKQRVYSEQYWGQSTFWNVLSWRITLNVNNEYHSKENTTVRCSTVQYSYTCYVLRI